MLPFGVKLRRGPPVYEQVIYAVHKALVGGQLKPGDAFPSVRALSRELQVNPNTAFKIVANLKQEGLLVVEPGRGTFISEDYDPPDKDRAALLERTIEELVVEARKLNLKKSDVQKAIDNHWKNL